jgi:hypothetical protein
MLILTIARPGARRRARERSTPEDLSVPRRRLAAARFLAEAGREGVIGRLEQAVCRWKEPLAALGPARQAGVRQRFAPHQLRHAHAVEMAREGVPLLVIQRQLGHVDLGITSVYLQGIDNSEIVDTVHSRRPPTISASVGLRL